MTEASLLTQVLVAEKYGPRLVTDQLATVLGSSRGAVNVDIWHHNPFTKADIPADVLADIYRQRVTTRGKGADIWGWSTAYGKPEAPAKQPDAGGKS